MSSAQVAAEVLSALASAESRDEQLHVLQQAWPASLLTWQDAKDLLCRLGKLDSRAAQLGTLKLADEAHRTVASLDVAVAPIIMQAPALRILRKVITRATSELAVAKCLDSLQEGCFLSAAQATDLMADVQAPAEQRFKWWHVICARVVDKWRLTEKAHTQICCYYGWDDKYCLHLVGGIDLDDHIRLQNKVLTHMGRVPSASLIPRRAALLYRQQV